MSVSLGANGANYNYPETGDLSWGANATNFASAVSAALTKLGLGATLTTDAIIDIVSTTKAIRIPSMTTTQRNAIAAPLDGFFIFNISTGRFNRYYSGSWKELFIADVITESSGNVGIGANAPRVKLDVDGSISIKSAFNLTWGGAFGANIPTIAASQNSGNGFIGLFPNGSTSGEQLRINANGNVGIGTISPSYKLELSTDSAGKPSTNVWTITSDERIKDNIELADLDICYNVVKNLPLKKYKWKYYTQEQAPDKNMLGWIAQDVQQHFPKAVNVSKFKISETESIDDCLNLNSDQINKALYGAVQKLQTIVEAQQAKITELENRINTLEGN